MTKYQLNARPNAYGCHDPQCLDSTWDHECPVVPSGQPEVAHGLFGPGIFGSGVDLSPLDEDTAHRLGVLVGQMINAAVEADRKRPESAEARSEVLIWDWKEDAPLERIGRTITEVSDHRAFLYPVPDTRTDSMAAVVSNRPLTFTEVQKIFDDFWPNEDES